MPKKDHPPLNGPLYAKNKETSKHDEIAVNPLADEVQSRSFSASPDITKSARATRSNSVFPSSTASSTPSTSPSASNSMTFSSSITASTSNNVYSVSHTRSQTLLHTLSKSPCHRLLGILCLDISLGLDLQASPKTSLNPSLSSCHSRAPHPSHSFWHRSPHQRPLRDANPESWSRMQSRQERLESFKFTSAANRLQPPLNAANLLNVGSLLMVFFLTLLVLKQQPLNEEENLLVKDTEFGLTPTQAEQLVTLQQQLDFLSDKVTNLSDYCVSAQDDNINHFLFERLDELKQIVKKWSTFKRLMENEITNENTVTNKALHELEKDIEEITHDVHEHTQTVNPDMAMTA